jgi:phosphate-selective porin OprO and OprP
MVRVAWAGAALAGALLALSAGGTQAQGPAAGRPQTTLPEPAPDRPGLEPRTENEKDQKAEGEKKAGDGKKKEEEEKKKDAPQWLEVGADLKMSAAWSHGFTAETADKAFRFHLGGRFDFDNAWFRQDPNLLLGPDPTVRLKDGSDFRRARLRADGQLWEFLDFVTEVNFANIQDVSNVDDRTVQVGSVGLTSFFVTFRDLPWVGNVRVGHFKAPYSLERYTSADYWYYLERSPIFDAFFGPNNYQNGLMVFDSYLDDRVTLAGSLTRVGRATVNSFGFDAENGLYATGVRLTGLPVYQCDGRLLVHLGANYFHQALSGNRIAVANRELIRGGGGPTDVPNLLATGNFFSPNGANVADLEAAAVLGPLSLSAEYAVAWTRDVFEQFDGVNFSGPRGNVTYQALYVEGGYFITPGDYRRYDRKTGTWARTVPQENAFVVRGEDGRFCGGIGAVQLLARFTYLDLVSGSPALTPTSGGARAGTQRDLTLGVNWYLNPQTFLALNYVFTHLDSVVPGASGDIHGVGVRLHLDF